MFNFFRNQPNNNDNSQHNQKDDVKHDDLKKEQKDITIGIDFGNCTCCVGVYLDNAVIIIPNDLGRRLTPTYISFTDNGRLFGYEAQNQSIRNSSNTIFDLHRLIGKKYHNLILQNDMRYWPFLVKSDSANNPLISVTYKNQIKEFYPEQLLAMILIYLKNNVRKYLNKNYLNINYNISNCVLSIPNQYNYKQRESIKICAKIAGFNFIELVNQSALCGVNYFRTNQQKRLILVYNLGGSTLNVSLLIFDNDIIEIAGINGDNSFGSNNFDNELIDYLSFEFNKKHKLNCNKSKRALMKIKKEIEKIKKNLIISNNYYIEIFSLFKNIDFTMNINKKQFENIILNKFKKRLIDPIEELLNEFDDYTKQQYQIETIVLCGSSVRIPFIQNIIIDYCASKLISQPNIVCKSINIDEYVAEGAVSFISMNEPNINLFLLDVTPITLSVGNIIDIEGDYNDNNDNNEGISPAIGDELIGGAVVNIIKKCSSIPCSKVKQFTTYKDNQNKLLIPIYEGESEYCDQNILLGILEMNIKTHLRGVANIEIEFDIDSKQRLTVTARDIKMPTNVQSLQIGIGNNLNINNNNINNNNTKYISSTKFNDNKINEFINIEKQISDDDKEIQNKLKAKDDLEMFMNGYCDKLQLLVTNVNNNKQSIMKQIDDNQNLSVNQLDQLQQSFKKNMTDQLKQLMH